jgi:pimeloyl-ACP methyl ester carboxylesterase
MPWLDKLPAKTVTSVSDLLPQIPTPALVYNGAQDMADFLHAADRFAACLPNVHVEKFPEAGGFPAWENPSAVNALVFEFLSHQAKLQPRRQEKLDILLAPSLKQGDL